MNTFTPAVRKWIYGLVAAGIPILVLFGTVAAEDIQVWLNFAAAVLGLGAAGLALPNTPASTEDPPKPLP
ncbi:phage holin [Arthrobacter luteolus]|uniref:phage holin n=1 Tax=Arthrobacter luteolus TaxID=98672 RepID=UPI00082A0299|nr:hypothetical protein [Arthrobacter luteolus]